MVLDASSILQAKMEDQQCGMRLYLQGNWTLLRRGRSGLLPMATSNFPCARTLALSSAAKGGKFRSLSPLHPSAPQGPGEPANCSAFSLTPQILPRPLLHCVAWSLSCPLALPLATAGPLTSLLTLKPVTFHTSSGASGKYESPDRTTQEG